MLVAEPQQLTEAARTILEEAGQVEVRACTTEELTEAFDRYDVIWIRLGHVIDAATIGSNPRCRLLAVPATGLDHVDLDACTRAGIRVVSLRGETVFLRDVRATAEHTVGLLLALVRHTVPAHASVLEGDWDRDRFRGRDLHGRRAGVVGVGRLGTLVAGYLSAFGMQVVGYDPRPDFPADVPADIERETSLVELLRRSDVVTLHVPLEPATHHLIGRDELAAMPPGSVLVNTSRGGLVDSQALTAALEAGAIAGAALDVVEGEPDIRDNPLWDYARHHSNLLLTPHLGGNTVESGAKTDVFLANLVRDVLDGTRP